MNYKLPFKFTFSAASPSLVPDSVKVAIERRSEEQQADTFTPLIPQDGPSGVTNVESREGDDGETGNLALYEASVLRTYMCLPGLSLCTLYVRAYVLCTHVL